MLLPIIHEAIFTFKNKNKFHLEFLYRKYVKKVDISLINPNKMIKYNLTESDLLLKQVFNFLKDHYYVETSSSDPLECFFVTTSNLSKWTQKVKRTFANINLLSRCDLWDASLNQPP